ncbi:MAG: hypothetical protein AB7S65_04025 [Sulfuricurvum sp.]
MSRKVSLLIVLFGIFSSVLIVYLDDFNSESVGLLQIVPIDLIAAFLLYVISKYVKINCIFLLIFIVLINVLLLFNTTGWSEGSMEGAAYTIQILKPATDLMYGLILISAFLLGIPLGLYIIFLVALSKLFCQVSDDS